MSKIIDCPICGGKAKIKETNVSVTYEAVQDKELIQKVGQLKKAMQKYKEKAAALEKELAELKNQ